MLPGFRSRCAFAVRFVQGVGHFNRILQSLLQRQRALLQPVRECFPFQIFHHQIIGSVLTADVKQRADVRMIQTGDGLRFALKALAQFGTICKMSRKNFDGNSSIEAGIAGL